MKIRIVNVDKPLTFVEADGELLELDHVRVVLQPGQYIILPDEEDEEDEEQPPMTVTHTHEDFAAFYDTLNRLGKLSKECVEKFGQEQPDPVCSCGKTSEGLCPRCGQFIDTPEQAKRDASIYNLHYDDKRFRRYFTTPFDQYKEHIGKAFTVVKQTRQLKLVTDEEEGEDDMYLIRLETGEEIEAFGHEVCVLEYDKCK